MYLVNRLNFLDKKDSIIEIQGDYMNPIKAVIFDLDGVIVSTDELHYQAWKYLCDIESIEFNRMINHRLRGVSRMASLEIILENTSRVYTSESKLKMATIKNDHYIKLLQTLSSKDILPEVFEKLEELRRKGFKIAIGSSSKNTPLILKQIGLEDVFDAVADGNDIIHSKPNPEVFLVAAQKLGIRPEYCMVIEDAEAGITAAKRAGMIAVAISDAKKSSEADYKVNHLIEIVSIIDKHSLN